ncbi:MAG: TfoX/Sxy family protein [Phyllobacteriaceae bacterium]|jgi:DNA transformation protein|nr:TfoX/Sxy family protein [Phyllobacteriaceae bacterium]
MDEDYLKDLFAPFGPITIKRMFGGQGVYCAHGIFALVAFDRLYLKGDDQSSPAYEAEGMERWVYEGHKNRRPTAMPYWQAPDEALESADAMEPWARLAVETAHRAKK